MSPSTSVPFHVLYVNGRSCSPEEAAISALDRGFTLGDGLFETMVARGGAVFRWPHHLARLKAGAGVLEMDLPTDAALAAAVQEVMGHVLKAEAVLRLTVTRGIDTGRGVGLPDRSSPTVVIRAMPLVQPSGEAFEEGLRAIISSVRRNEGSPLSRIKSLNYGDSVLAKREAQKRGRDEAIMLNNRGDVACASTANLFVVKAGEVWTPPAESGALPGITRACILELAVARGTPVREQPFGAESLLQADETFVTNSVIEVMPLTAVEGQIVGTGKPGPVTRELAGACREMVARELAAGR